MRVGFNTRYESTFISTWNEYYIQFSLTTLTQITYFWCTITIDWTLKQPEQTTNTTRLLLKVQEIFFIFCICISCVLKSHACLLTNVTPPTKNIAHAENHLLFTRKVEESKKKIEENYQNNRRHVTRRVSRQPDHPKTDRKIGEMLCKKKG